ncbi:hypothetical protein BOC45_08270 [Burkholderia pseudomallei]|nr:hypothetical protein BOC45_08270 [Burkholderia pseudomallei]
MMQVGRMSAREKIEGLLRVDLRQSRVAGQRQATIGQEATPARQRRMAKTTRVSAILTAPL